MFFPVRSIRSEQGCENAFSKRDQRGALTKLTEIFYLWCENILVILLGVLYGEKDRVKFSYHAQVVWGEV